MKMTDLLDCGTIPEVGMIVYAISEDNLLWVDKLFQTANKMSDAFEIKDVRMTSDNQVVVLIQNIRTKELAWDGFFARRFSTKCSSKT